MHIAALVVGVVVTAFVVGVVVYLLTIIRKTVYTHQAMSYAVGADDRSKQRQERCRSDDEQGASPPSRL